MAKEALERIAALYAIEEEIRGRSAEERRAARNERSRPLLESMKKWFEETLASYRENRIPPRQFATQLGRWDALLRFCDDGHLEIDNNAAERSLRAVVLGRNYANPKIMYRSTQTIVSLASVQADYTLISSLMYCCA